MERDVVLRAKEVADRLGIAVITLRTWYRKGKFPQPIKLGNHAVGWRESVIEKWIDDREAEARERGLSDAARDLL